MKTNSTKTENKVLVKADFFKTVLADKRDMREYIKKNGSLKGFKSDHFDFAKPI